MDRCAESNRARWDECAAIHERSDFHDVESFAAGKVRLPSSLRAHEPATR